MSVVSEARPESVHGSHPGSETASVRSGVDSVRSESHAAGVAAVPDQMQGGEAAPRAWQDVPVLGVFVKAFVAIGDWCTNVWTSFIGLFGFGSSQQAEEVPHEGAEVASVAGSHAAATVDAALLENLRTAEDGVAVLQAAFVLTGETAYAHDATAQALVQERLAPMELPEVFAGVFEAADRPEHVGAEFGRENVGQFAHEVRLELEAAILAHGGEVPRPASPAGSVHSAGRAGSPAGSVHSAGRAGSPAGSVHSAGRAGSPAGSVHSAGSHHTASSAGSAHVAPVVAEGLVQALREAQTDAARQEALVGAFADAAFAADAATRELAAELVNAMANAGPVHAAVFEAAGSPEHAGPHFGRENLVAHIHEAAVQQAVRDLVV